MPEIEAFTPVWHGDALGKLKQIEKDFGKKALKFIQNGREIIGQNLRKDMKKAGLLDKRGRILAFYPGTWPDTVYREVIRQAQKAKTERINARQVAVKLKSTHNAVTSALATLERDKHVKKQGKARGTRWYTVRLFSSPPSPRGGD